MEKVSGSGLLKKGFSLIEVLTAVVILAVSYVAINFAATQTLFYQKRAKRVFEETVAVDNALNLAMCGYKTENQTVFGDKLKVRYETQSVLGYTILKATCGSVSFGELYTY